VSVDGNLDELTKRLEAGAEEHKVPGTVAGVLVDGEPTVSTTGVTSVDNPLPVTPETLFSIGSMTKTFTSTSMMMLVDKGKVDLEAKVRKYIPELKLADEAVAENVKVRHLLTHTAGWLGDWFADTGPGDDAREKLVERLPEAPQLTPLGKVCSYNNSAVALAGRVIEVVTGSVYEDAVRELVFQPLGLENSFFSAMDVMSRRFVIGHRVTKEGPKVFHNVPGTIGAAPMLLRSAAATGGIWSTVPDVLRYATFHLNGGTMEGKFLLSKELVELMQTPQSQLSLVHIGMPWFISDAAGTKLVMHGGNYSNMQIAELLLVPDRNFAYALLTNSGGGGALNVELMKWSLDHYLGVQVPDPEIVDVSAEVLSDYVGRYDNPVSGTLEVTLENGGLAMRSRLPESVMKAYGMQEQPAMKLRFRDETTFSLEGRGMLGGGDFIRGENGKVEWLRFGARISRRLPDEEATGDK
jgi:CubicO group peptidase (beta-lactamase class C family)